MKKPESWAWITDLEWEFKGQNDRSIAIVSASFLDEWLKMLITDFLVKDTSKEEDLFAPYKPLSTFYGKIKMAYYLGLISETEYKNLDIIRNIRNDFAHELGEISFKNSPVIDRCKNLVLPPKLYQPHMFSLPEDGTIPKIDLTTPTPDTPKKYFIAVVEYIFRAYTWRYFDIINRKRTTPKDFSSAAEGWKFVIDTFNKFSEKLKELEKKSGIPKEEAYAESNFGKLTEYNILPRLDYLIKVLEYNYKENSANTD